MPRPPALAGGPLAEEWEEFGENRSRLSAAYVAAGASAIQKGLD